MKHYRKNGYYVETRISDYKQTQVKKNLYIVTDKGPHIIKRYLMNGKIQIETPEIYCVDYPETSSVWRTQYYKDKFKILIDHPEFI